MNQTVVSYASEINSIKCRNKKEINNNNTKRTEETKNNKVKKERRKNLIAVVTGLYILSVVSYRWCRAKSPMA